MQKQDETLTVRFAQANASLAGATQSLLGAIIHDGALHADFLNTLSMLEHMGSHKIMATQHGPMIDQATLKHLAEEARHAFFFKRQAEREAPSGAAGLMAPSAARGYFQRLEAEILRDLPAQAPARTAYLTMSLTVEFRAIWAYRLYQEVLTRAGSAMSLKSLLAEESGHLGEMVEGLRQIGQFDSRRLQFLWDVEQKLYRRLLAQLQRAVTARQSVAA